MSSTPEGVVPRSTPAAVAGIFALVFAAILLVASSAQASEVVYWDNYGADNVGFANVDGSGGGLLNLGSGKLDGPEGMDYDSASNRLFVANEEGVNGEILAINLNGSGATPFSAPGAPIEEPEGIAIYPPTNTIYWMNVDTESISWAKLDGSAGGVLNLAGAPVDGPCCRITIDPVGGRVYWVNDGASPISIGYANLNNTGGGGELSYAGSSIEPGGEALAVDDASGRLYFTNGQKIGYANLNGSGGGDVAPSSAIINGPWGLAFDPSISRLYWANESNGPGKGANAFGFTGVSGGAGGGISMADALIANPQDPVIIKSPSGTGAPVLTRDSKARSLLTCSQGTWASDFPGAFVYQAPRTYAYQWSRNGQAVAGATATTLNASSAGTYACTVTAANQIGSAAQASAAVKVKSAKVKLTTKKKVNVKPGGTAKFKLKGVNQGDIQSKKARVCVKLPKSAKGVLKAPKCATLGKLKGRGKHGATLKVKVGKSAVGTYKVSFSVHGSPGTSAKATIVIAAPKKK